MVNSSKTFPVSVEWGGVWVDTVGRPGSIRKKVEARVYDPHGKQWVWMEFNRADCRFPTTLEPELSRTNSH